ncbi:MAG: hypothetical protein KY455_01405 [Euryarchaeota archaeon]|nr:hypothetical protein [Euryarchaeota archaeon]
MTRCRETPLVVSRRRRARPTRWSRIAIVFLFLLPLSASPGLALLDVSVTDATVAQVTATPTSSDPGPVLHSAADGLEFSSGLTDIAAAWYAEYSLVTNNTSAQGATVQGVSHTFADWFYAKQDDNPKYSTMNVTGVYDADAAAYTVPLLFTKSSQGTLALRWYNGTSPTSGGTDVTMYWAYDAVENKYVIGASKDLSLETQVAPITATLQTTYERTIQGNDYIVKSVAAAGSDYVPTLMQGHHLPLVSLPLSHTWYPLMDPPPGVLQDDYDFTLRVTVVAI